MTARSPPPTSSAVRFTDTRPSSNRCPREGPRRESPPAAHRAPAGGMAQQQSPCHARAFGRVPLGVWSVAVTYPRDLRGYGPKPPHPRWPHGARIALQFVLNHEEGAENCVLDGDPSSETFLSEIIGAPAFPMRHMSMESLFEYGSRPGLGRVLRAFERRRLPITVFGVARALERHPEAVAAYRELGHEIAAHGLRWISYQTVDEAVEREHLAEAVAILKTLTGTAPLGWYTGRDSPNTRRLVIEHGGFLYDSDSYPDDLPYWIRLAGAPSPPHLVIPYALDSNDMRFAAAQGFNS